MILLLACTVLWAALHEYAPVMRAGLLPPQPAGEPLRLASLHVVSMGTELHLRWAADSPLVLQAAEARLLVTQAGSQRSIPLDRSQLAAGSTNLPASPGEVEVALELTRGSELLLRESARVEEQPQ
jgi:hypothetical protein